MEISTKHCEYDKKRKVLKLASEYVGMPAELLVTSEHTGRQVKFVPLTESDPLFDPDHWDGEQKIYRPVGLVPKVNYLVIYNQY